MNRMKKTKENEGKQGDSLTWGRIHKVAADKPRRGEARSEE